jgi:AraC-like DNA-binding protein
MSDPVARYREYAPCAALRDDVDAFFALGPWPGGAAPARPVRRELTFTEAPLCAPQFADGHVSLSLELGRAIDGVGRWHVAGGGPRGTVIGPMTAVGRTVPGPLPETIGAFLRPARAAAVLGVAVSELTDRCVAIEDVWGTASARLPGDLGVLDEAARLDRLESVLLARLAPRRSRAAALDVAGLAAIILGRHGRVGIDDLARAAGVSRQYLSRAFGDEMGIPPKTYARLARFDAVLAYVGSGARLDWAGVAVDCGYADQSHMIADVRAFAGLTPHVLASRAWFHPFIERAKSRRDGPYA